MQRQVTAHVDAQINSTSDVVLSIALANGYNITSESLSFTGASGALEYQEIVEPDGTRLHSCVGIPQGTFTVEYAATVEGSVQNPPSEDLAPHVYRRPSRYCESDKLLHIANAEFSGLEGFELLDAVRSWVHQRVFYFSGWSRVTDGAVDTFMQRQGVCRDFAHLVIAFLRARNVPARLSSVYAPGLSPMDFHAVAEAYVDGAWFVIDATGLAPRESMLRIAIGRDAADTAFMTTTRGSLRMGGMWVTSIVSPDLPREDPAAHIQLT